MPAIHRVVVGVLLLGLSGCHQKTFEDCMLDTECALAFNRALEARLPPEDERAHVLNLATLPRHVDCELRGQPVVFWVSGRRTEACVEH